MTEDILLKYQLDVESHFQEQGLEIESLKTITTDGYSDNTFDLCYVGITLVDGSTFSIYKNGDKMIESYLVHDTWSLNYKDVYIHGILHELIVKYREL